MWVRPYALELPAAAGFPNPGEGKLVRVHGSGQLEDIVTHLVVPAHWLTTVADGAFYISNFGAAPPGMGQILRVTLPD
jgi:hypothetical protein